MLHEGVSVILHRTMGDQKHHTEDPDPHAEQDADGEVGSNTRVINARPGERFYVGVTFDEDFKLPKTTGVGVAIAIAIGGSTKRFSQNDNKQVFWLYKKMKSLNHCNSFSRFATFRPGAVAIVDEWVSMLIPAPSRGTATTNTQDFDDFFAADGCISVYVVRGTLDEEFSPGEGLTQPPRKYALNPAYATPPKHIITAQSFTPLKSKNGKRLAFHFRNVAPDTIKPAHPEPALGSNAGTVEHEIEAGSSKRKGTSDSNDAKRLKATPNIPSPEKSSTKNRPTNKAHSQNSQSTTSVPSSDGRAAAQRSDGQDDDEELPTKVQPHTKPESTNMPDSSVAQSPTLPLSKAGNQSRTATPIRPAKATASAAIDLTANDNAETDTKTEDQSPPQMAEQAAVTDVDSEPDFDYESREAEIEREFQRKKNEIEKRRRAHEKKRRAGVR